MRVTDVRTILFTAPWTGDPAWEALEAFSDAIDIPRAQRTEAIAALIRRYAVRLQEVARSAPCNWFNFYDFWGPEETRAHAEVASPKRALQNDAP